MSPAARKKSARRGSKAAPKRPSVLRWLALPAGLLIAGGAIFALLAPRDPSSPPSVAGPPVAQPPHVERHAAPEEHGHYDEESREQLRAILDAAEDDAEGRGAGEDGP